MDKPKSSLSDYIKSSETQAMKRNSNITVRMIKMVPEMLKVLIEITEYLTPNKLNSIGTGSVLHKKIDSVIEKTTGQKIADILKD